MSKKTSGPYISVVRAKRHVIDINPGVVGNPNISFAAQAIWVHVLCGLDVLRFRDSELAKLTKERRDEINSALEELVQNGYAVKKQEKNPDGTWKEPDHIFFHTLEDAEEHKKELALNEKQPKKEPLNVRSSGK